MLNKEKYDAIIPYVTNLDSDVFALKNLPEEVAAVLFAYYSRSPYGLRDNLLQLLGDGDLNMSDLYTSETSYDFEGARAKAKAFHEKWVVGYGHSSVAEHSVIKLALENISIIASKLVEDSRLASYTEKSTRYVQFTEDSVYIPETFGLDVEENNGLLGLYTQTVKNLMRTNLDLVPVFTKRIMEETTKGVKQSDKGFETSCRATAYDTLRYLLPAALLTNVGVTINARSLANMIVKLRSSRNHEAISLSNQIKNEADKISPTLLKYVDASKYRESQLDSIKMCPNIYMPRTNQQVSVVDHYIPENLALHLMSIGTDYENNQYAFLDMAMRDRGTHESVPRQFERVSLSFRILTDYGGFRDIQRHRLTTQITYGVHPYFGYETPDRIVRYGYEYLYTSLMEESNQVYRRLESAGGIAASFAPYVLPLGTRIAVIFTGNLRELFEFVELRSARHGHPSYRRIAQEMFKEIEKIYPNIAKYIRVDMKNYDLTRLEK